MFKSNILMFNTNYISVLCHKVEYSWFEFRVFLLLNWLPNQRERSQSAVLFTDSLDTEMDSCLSQSDTQTAPARTRTQIDDFISFEDIRYT